VVRAEFVVFGSEVLVFGVEAFVAGACFVEALLEPVVTMPERVVLDSELVEFATQPLLFFRCLLLLVDELGGEGVAFGERGGEEVAVTEGVDERDGFGLSLLAGSPGALTITSAGPFAWSTSFAWNRHQRRR
jgi:hypothetical protein